MALVKITPRPARVRVDRRTARPLAVRLDGRELHVTGLDTVREELAAYPAERGPRVTFLVETDRGQASLVYDGRRREWFVEALDQAA